MEPIAKIINALNALTVALQEYAQQTAENYTNTFEEIPTTEDEPKSSVEPTAEVSLETDSKEQQKIDYIQLRERLADIAKAGHASEIKNLIRKYGATKASELDSKCYADLLADAEALV